MKPEDRAQELELEEWERRQKDAIQPVATEPSAKWCKGAGCGERIPDARRKAMPGVQFCIECQELEDKKKRGRYAGAN